MSQQELLERDPVAGRSAVKRKPQDARAQAANRPRRNLQHHDTASVDAALGVYGSMVQSQRVHGLLNGRDDFLLLRLTERRRCDVDGLFEKRTIERIRFVEDRERSNVSPGEHALNGILTTLDEAFDDDLLPAGMSKRAHRGAGEQRADAVYRGGALLRTVGANDTAAA